ncbi:MAG: hypothetical protein COA96_00090 [SAR86 cluster bacterium]|uniref:Leucine-rich repeat domain-containing protein n=1 Tax=SAR86 cluster bacterium TaxID=2030880 RepID=A0A2A5BAQ9_9GAMM|nr:MAG: hypothetical protein COA96_00090 [SAR86 cluster bacterium]
MKLKFTKTTITSCLIAFVLASCSQQFTVSINNQAVFDPNGRLIAGQLADANLQGCVNLAMQQQGLQNAALLTVLSCANSEITDLGNIGQLAQLRFLDLGNNNISNITPLEELTQLGGLNLMNNVITDISVLLGIPSLVSVSLLGNNQIPCAPLQVLEEKLGENLNRPESCQN